jgi:hypothetical protein
MFRRQLVRWPMRSFHRFQTLRGFVNPEAIETQIIDHALGAQTAQ